MLMRDISRSSVERVEGKDQLNGWILLDGRMNEWIRGSMNVLEYTVEIHAYRAAFTNILPRLFELDFYDGKSNNSKSLFAIIEAPRRCLHCRGK